MNLKFLSLLVLLVITFRKVTATVEDIEPSTVHTGGSVGARTKLVEAIFKNYNKNVYPDNCTVKYGMALINFHVDEKESTLESHVWFRQVWLDQRLQWNPEDYGNITVIRFPQTEVWKPDITLYNSMDQVNRASCWNGANVLIYSSGEVLFVPPCKLHSQCNFAALKKQPYGEQTCSIKMGSWTYDADSVDVQLYKNETVIDLSDINNTSGFEVVSTSVQRNVRYYACCPEPYVDVAFNMTIKRIPGEELVRWN